MLFLLCLISNNLYAHFSHLKQAAYSEKQCVVMLTNKGYFPKFLETVDQLTHKGNYRGDICLIIGDDLLGNDLLNNDVIKKNNIIIKHFPDLYFPEQFKEMTRDFPQIHKLFQYHKFHLFNTYFKRWKTILYIDVGMKIYADIYPILKTRQPNTLLAHSDAFPTYKWQLSDQFNKKELDLYDKLRRTYKLDIDYFQTTMMLYDTSIIQETTFDDLYHLALEYPLSFTNDQGIVALYFTNISPVWRQIKTHSKQTYFYDFFKRKKGKKYIMVKY